MPPANFTGDLQIKVLAFDQYGMQAEAVFQFHVGKLQQAPGGKVGFTERIRQLAYVGRGATPQIVPRAGAFRR